MRLATRLFLLVITLSGLGACGQKGPLFLPDAEQVNQAKSIKQALEQRKAESEQNSVQQQEQQ